MSNSQSHKFKELSRGTLSRAWQVYKQVNERIYISEFLIAFVVCLLLVTMIRQQIGSPNILDLKEGEIATRIIRASQSYEIEDADHNATQRGDIAALVRPVYDFDSERLNQTVDEWRSALRDVRKSKESVTRTSKALGERLGTELTAEEFRTLSNLKFSADLERSIVFSISPFWHDKIIDSKQVPSSGIEIMDLRNGQNRIFKPSEVGKFLLVEEARNMVGKTLERSASGGRSASRMPWHQWTSEQRQSVFAIQSRLLKANVTLNRKETEARKSQALKDFKPLVMKFERGEVIAREGEKINKRTAYVISELRKTVQIQPVQNLFLFEALFGAFFLWLAVFFLRREYPTMVRPLKDNLLTVGLLLVSVASLKLTLLFEIHVMAEFFANTPASFFLFLIPTAAPAMMLRLMINTPYAAGFAVIHGIAAGLLVESGNAFGVHVALTSLVGLQFLGLSRTRADLHVAGLRTALMSGISAVVVMAAWGGEVSLTPNLAAFGGASHFGLTMTLIWTFAGGMLGGWLSSALTLILTPILESVLDYTTDLKLLELARMDHPLLRELVVRAPGTYHHSIVVGSLVEAAAEAIGANALLARVGSYYHDIGKLGRPEYFVENQTRGHNPHDNTSPQLSAKIIISHVKEGIVMAQKSGLGQDLINFIETHHGTTTVSYFYNKARYEAGQPDSSIKPDEIREDDFRYPGPKPRTREEAIVALADACEAATRSLVEPTPARIEGMIKKIIARAFEEELLTEAPITLREVNLAANSFLRILLGIHHTRIAYPDQEKGLPKAPPISIFKPTGNG